jgi:hypothetical protein
VIRHNYQAKANSEMGSIKVRKSKCDQGIKCRATSAITKLGWHFLRFNNLGVIIRLTLSVQSKAKQNNGMNHSTKDILGRPLALATVCIGNGSADWLRGSID